MPAEAGRYRPGSGPEGRGQALGRIVARRQGARRRVAQWAAEPATEARRGRWPRHEGPISAGERPEGARSRTAGIAPGRRAGSKRADTAGGRAPTLRAEQLKLLADERDRTLESFAVLRDVQPPARTRRVRKRDRHGAPESATRPHVVGQTIDAENTVRREAAHRDDESRPKETELAIEPTPAQLELGGRRPAVSSPSCVPSRIAAGHRAAVEGPVEALLVEFEPASKRPPGAAAPWAAFLRLDDARRLPDQQDGLVASLEHRRRLDGVAGVRTGPAPTVGSLERSKRTMARRRHGP